MGLVSNEPLSPPDDRLRLAHRCAARFASRNEEPLSGWKSLYSFSKTDGQEATVQFVAPMAAASVKGPFDSDSRRG
jgi:hypothetical protein